MKQKIITRIGDDQAASVEARAAKMGIDDIWKRAETRARAELGAEAPDADVVTRAAIRAQQMVAVIPKFAPAKTAKEESEPQPKEPATPLNEPKKPQPKIKPAAN